MDQGHEVPPAPGEAGDRTEVSAAGPDDQRATELIERFRAARAGSTEAKGYLLESCRNYLLLVANQAVKEGLQAKVGASDLVQETFVEAQRIFDRFAGGTEEELLRWLKQILEHKIGNTLKQYLGIARRDISREIDWQRVFGSGFFEGIPIANGTSPSGALRSQEERERFQQAIGSLPDDHREVIRLHVEQGLPFEEVGLKMNRSPAAVQRLFVRIVSRLKDLLANNHDQRHESQ